MASDAADQNQQHTSEDACRSSNASPGEALNLESGLNTPIQLPPEPRICTDCSRLPLRRALEKSYSSSVVNVGVPIAPVGHRYRKFSETGCPLCSMILSSRLGNTDDFGAGIKGEQIRCHGFVIRSEFADSWSIPPGIRFESMYLALRRQDMDNAALLRLRKQERLEDRACAVVLQDGKRPAIFVPQAVPISFNTHIVKSWLSYCKKNHTALCGQINSPVPGLRVIDCATLSVRAAEEGDAYLALSYVWGTSTSDNDRVRSVDNMVLLPEILSSIISDAITVTKSLGFQYLWVDKFCIDQENSAVKHDQIQQMRSVYENAELTIIAAAGTDGSYGLPGVGRRPRTPQPIARLEGGLSVISTMRDPHKAIRSSHWATRGWTYQEAVLSRRRLVFTDEQLYFECNAMNCWESIYSPLDLVHKTDRSRFHDWLRSGMFTIDEAHPEEVIRLYWLCIEEYSSRDLTFDSDSIQAFQGIVERFSKMTQPVLAIWGLPYPPSTEKRIDSFVRGLTWFHSQSCWENTQRPRRRQGFPSWSWAGWAGEVHFSIHLPNGMAMSVLQSGITNIAFKDKNNKTAKLEALDIVALEKHDFSLLRLQAKPLPLPIWFDYRSIELEYRLMPWKFGGAHSNLYLSQGPVTRAQLAQELNSDTHAWRCIWICSINRNSFAMLLNLNPETGAWVRVGMIWFEFHANLMIHETQYIDPEWFSIE